MISAGVESNCKGKVEWCPNQFVGQCGVPRDLQVSRKGARVLVVALKHEIKVVYAIRLKRQIMS
ncbi:MAG: hypothetical protein OEW33_16460, partial [Nitrospirota bacterium]|nr:hypothetical protein [Nitrospirota bacterium]